MVLNTNFVKHFNNVTVEGLKNLIEKKVLVLPSSKYKRLLVQSQTRVVYGKESGDVQVILFSSRFALVSSPCSSSWDLKYP